MKDIYKSISLDNGRVVLSEKGGSRFIQKATTKKEVENLIIFSKHIDRLDPVLLAGTSYKMTTPHSLDWDPNTSLVRFEFKYGDNLEEILRDTSFDRPQNITFVKDFFDWMKSSGTFWRGAAPRHIIVNKSINEITLLDFERPIDLKISGFDEAEFQLKTRGLVHEEFCAFLFDEEQSIVFPHIWDYNENQQVETKRIFGKRVNLLIKYFFNPKDGTIPTEQLLFVYKFMSSVVTPYLVKNKPFFPILALDKVARDPKDYLNVVTNLMKIDRQDWPKYLKYENA